MMRSVIASRALPIAVLAVASACSRLPPPSLASATAVADTVWYISARARVDGRDSRTLADSLEYGLAIFAREPSGDPHVDPVRLALVDSLRLTKSDFVARLRARTLVDTTQSDFAVLYVHGFGTSLHEAWTYGTTARLRSGSSAPWIAFAWPSNGSGIAAPRRGEILSRAYREDSSAAVSSHADFANALRSTMAAVDADRLVLAPHSLGGQLVGETLASDTALRATLGQAPLRAIAFLAPDVETRRFVEYLVPAVLPLTRRLLLYASARDRVLAMSREVNGSQRAGLAHAPVVRTGLETVNVTGGPSAGNWLQRTFGTHHAIRRASGTLFDLAWIVGPERSGDCRLALGTASLRADGAWELTPVLPTARRPGSDCPSVRAR